MATPVGQLASGPGGAARVARKRRAAKPVRDAFVAAACSLVRLRRLRFADRLLLRWWRRLGWRRRVRVVIVWIRRWAAGLGKRWSALHGRGQRLHELRRSDRGHRGAEDRLGALGRDVAEPMHEGACRPDRRVRGDEQLSARRLGRRLALAVQLRARYRQSEARRGRVVRLRVSDDAVDERSAPSRRVSRACGPLARLRHTVALSTRLHR